MILGTQWRKALQCTQNYNVISIAVCGYVFPCKCALKITNSYKKSHFLVLICFSADNDDDDEDEIVANDVTAEKSHREETSGRK